MLKSNRDPTQRYKVIIEKPTYACDEMHSSFYSNTSHKFKSNAIKILVHRAYHLSTSFFSINQEIKFLRDVFTSNGHPAFIFDAVRKKFMEKMYPPPTVPLATVPKMQFNFSVPCYNYQNEPLIQNLANRLSIYYN